MCENQKLDGRSSYTAIIYQFDQTQIIYYIIMGGADLYEDVYYINGFSYIQ